MAESVLEDCYDTSSFTELIHKEPPHQPYRQLNQPSIDSLADQMAFVVDRGYAAQWDGEGNETHATKTIIELNFVQRSRDVSAHDP